MMMTDRHSNNLGRDEVGTSEDSGLPGETTEQSIGEQELLAEFPAI
jgi:hypothetical protein